MRESRLVRVPGASIAAAKEIQALGRSFHAAGYRAALVADFNRRARAITQRHAAMTRPATATPTMANEGRVFP